MARKDFVRECITLSFVDLLSEKKYENISITDITEKAGVSRTSFYRYYSTKKELLEYIQKNTQTEMANGINAIINAENTYEAVLHALDYTEEQKKYLSLYIKGEALNFSILLNTRKEKDLFTEISYTDMIKYSLIATVFIKWLNDGMKEPVTKIAGIISENLNKLK